MVVNEVIVVIVLIAAALAMTVVIVSGTPITCLISHILYFLSHVFVIIVISRWEGHYSTNAAHDLAYTTALSL